MARSLVNQLAALVGRVDNILVEFYLSETNGSCQAQTWMALLTDGDANHYAIPLPFYHIDMTTHYLDFGKPVGSTGGDKLITCQ